MELFGDRLRELRENRDLKQQEVAKALFISNKVLSSYERNVAYPSIEMLKKICEYYNISADYLLDTALRSEDKAMDEEPKQSTFLTQEQLKVLEYYDNLNKIQKDAVLGLMAFYKISNTNIPLDNIKNDFG